MQLCQEAESGNDYERALLTKLVGGDTVPNFVWLSSQSQYKFFHATQHLNRIEFLHLNFSIKTAMVKLGRQISAKYGSFNHPRALEITNAKDIEEFDTEFKWTTVTSIIMFLNCHLHVSDDKSAISTEPIDIALLILQTGFLNCFEKVHEAYKLVTTEETKFFGRALTRLLYKTKLRNAAEEILTRWPDRAIDGFKNVWIVKPSLSNRGEGIFVSNERQKILDYINQDERDYVIQKYIENPLLIYDSKFDIRFYFVISIDRRFFRGWAHPSCHIKLASQAFDLNCYDEAIHVTNITVQKKYTQRTSEHLPANHVWSLGDLKSFLDERKNPGLWNRRIFPAMKLMLKQICEASRENIELRAGRVELFGCDFMITDTYEVQLLEINRGPCLENLTPVSTAALKTVLEDFVKSNFFVQLHLKHPPTTEI